VPAVDDGRVSELGAFGSGVDLTARSAAVAETDVSVVLFVGDRAYKLKKPVRTAFLDYSTRATREAICHREVELNARLAADVYLGVVDLVGPDGAPWDHLVAMRRMPDERRLAALVRSGAATTALIRGVAREIAAFHTRAERRPDIDAAATPEAVRRLGVDDFGQGLYTPARDRADLQRVAPASRGGDIARRECRLDASWASARGGTASAAWLGPQVPSWSSCVASARPSWRPDA
jgi:aminoglycoside phosphotransferase family enzyme